MRSQVRGQGSRPANQLRDCMPESCVGELAFPLRCTLPNRALWRAGHRVELENPAQAGTQLAPRPQTKGSGVGNTAPGAGLWRDGDSLCAPGLS